MQRLFALILLILTIPVSFLTGLMIIITTGSPVFFLQERIGRNKLPFTIYKFKSMRNGRITFIGKVIRKTGLDEIPQLINILKGEMSFVGPRPLTQTDIDRLKWTTQEHNFRWSVNPGITGAAQLSNICNADNSLSLDKKYVSEKSSQNDLKLFVRSILIPIVGKSKKQ